MITAKSAIAYLKKTGSVSGCKNSLRCGWLKIRKWLKPLIISVLWGQWHENTIVKCNGLSARHFTNTFYNFVN